ncbi:hypothetical protein DSLPV1_123 [Dishui lake phycodnavirus 1]|uniref:hypothetical protein n=1 Tax=Dishui lake phycodnavirus 1 TaxID=2079134 RepID=UPI000CD69C98|nr:hypothetical protein C5Y57_gp123 [Dishui lake phycodnavirus 1]AUT19094.1 hypothetical protein DSLPV1_123 [Dishui lake phycodnavirus 1]
MSFVMGNDKNAMDRINPFVTFPPGGVRRSGDFADYTKMFDKDHGVLKPDGSSIACNVSRTAGDRTIDFCTTRLPNCNANRPHYPNRQIDEGHTGYVQRRIQNGREVSMERTQPHQVSPSPRRAIVTAVVRYNRTRIIAAILLFLLIIYLLQ